jgi:hypothetical protein
MRGLPGEKSSEEPDQCAYKRSSGLRTDVASPQRLADGVVPLKADSQDRQY